MIKVVHILDKNGYRACDNKIPKKYKNQRIFDFGWSDVDKITCIKCKKIIGSPYYSDEYFFNLSLK
jgi:hypothetical protein